MYNTADLSKIDCIPLTFWKLSMKPVLRSSLYALLLIFFAVPENIQAFFCPGIALKVDLGEMSEVVLEGDGFSRGNFLAMEYDPEFLEFESTYLEDKLEGRFMVTGIKAGVTTAKFHWEFTDKSDEGVCEVEFTIESNGLDREAMKTRLGEYIGFKGYNLDDIWAFSPQEPLETGTIVASADGEVEVEVNQPAWLAWIDLNKDVRFGHPGDLVFIDQQSGEITSYDTKFWPIIDGNPYLSLFGDRLISNDLICGTPPEPLDEEITTTIEEEEVPEQRDSVCAVLVSGSADTERQEEAFSQDIEFMKKNLMLESMGPRLAEENIEVMHNASKLEIRNKLESMAGKYKKVYFYYSGHGSDGYMVTNDEVGEGMLYASLASALDVSRAEEVCVVIDACRSGSAIRAFENWPGLRDQSIEVFTACSNDTSSWTRNISTGGEVVRVGEYTWAFVQCFGDPDADKNDDGMTSFMEAHEWLLEQNVELGVGGTINERMRPQRYKHESRPITEREAVFEELDFYIELDEELDPNDTNYVSVRHNFGNFEYEIDPKITFGIFNWTFDIYLRDLVHDTLRVSDRPFRVGFGTRERVQDTNASNQPAVGVADTVNNSWTIGPNIEFDASAGRVYSGPFHSGTRVTFVQQQVEPNSVADEEKTTSDWLTLFQNYPNPIVGNTTSIPIKLQKSATVFLDIHTIGGEQVYRSSATQLHAGEHFLDVPETALADIANQVLVYTVRAQSGAQTLVLSRKLMTGAN